MTLRRPMPGLPERPEWTLPAAPPLCAIMLPGFPCGVAMT